MPYSLQIKRSAVKALNALQKIDRERLIAAIDRLRRLRVGRFRIVYEWQQQALIILVVRIVVTEKIFINEEATGRTYRGATLSRQVDDGSVLSICRSCKIQQTAAVRKWAAPSFRSEEPVHTKIRRDYWKST